MGEESGDIDELADAFVKNLRNQLKIQPDESSKRYQEMVARDPSKESLES